MEKIKSDKKRSGIIKDLPLAHQRRFLRYLNALHPDRPYDQFSEYNREDYERFKTGK